MGYRIKRGDTLTGSTWEEATGLIDWSSWGTSKPFVSYKITKLTDYPNSLFNRAEKEVFTVENITSSNQPTEYDLNPEYLDEKIQVTTEYTIPIQEVKNYDSFLNYCSQQTNLIKKNRAKVINEITQIYNNKDLDAIDTFRTRMLAIAPYFTWLTIECLDDITVQFADHSHEIYSHKCDRMFYSHFTKTTGITLEEVEVGVYSIRGFEKNYTVVEDDRMNPVTNDTDFELIQTDEHLTFTSNTRPEDLYLSLHELLNRLNQDIEAQITDQESDRVIHTAKSKVTTLVLPE